MFVQTLKKGKKLHCTTEDVLSMNERNNEAFADVCKQTIRCDLSLEPNRW
jgi:hypothetical protein